MLNRYNHQKNERYSFTIPSKHRDILLRIMIIIFGGIRLKDGFCRSSLQVQSVCFTESPGMDLCLPSKKKRKKKKKKAIHATRVVIGQD